MIDIEKDYKKFLKGIREVNPEFKPTDVEECMWRNGYLGGVEQALKKRLREKGYFSTIRIPNFPRLGFELFKISYGNLNRTTAIEQRLGVAKEMFDDLKEFVLVLSESNQAINIAVAKNYTEYEKGKRIWN